MSATILQPIAKVLQPITMCSQPKPCSQSPRPFRFCACGKIVCLCREVLFMRLRQDCLFSAAYFMSRTATNFIFPAENSCPNYIRILFLQRTSFDLKISNTAVLLRDLASTVFQIYAALVASRATRRQKRQSEFTTLLFSNSSTVFIFSTICFLLFHALDSSSTFIFCRVVCLFLATILCFLCGF